MPTSLQTSAQPKFCILLLLGLLKGTSSFSTLLSSDSSIAFYFQVDLKKALDLGVIINLDNEFEMEVVDELLKNECKGLETPSIGLRLNPVVGGGTISIFNTATKLSKFGLPLVEETR